MNFPLLLVALLGSIGPVQGLDVSYGDSVDFPETENCTKPGAELWIETNDQLVARRDGDEWKEGPKYVNRIRPGKSVILMEATMNDSGLFVLVCPGEEETRTQLNVAAASLVSVAAGGEISFPFMYKTSGATGEFRVKRKGEEEPVLKLNLASESEKATIRPDFEERLSLSSNWKAHGDLTVTMRPVTAEDQGDFFLYVMDGGKKQLSAWRVTVTNPGKTTITAPTGPTGGNLETGTAVGFGLGGFLCGAVITGLACFFCDERLKSLKSKLSRRRAQNEQEQGSGGDAVPLKNKGRPASSECNGNLGGLKGKHSVSATAGHPLIEGSVV